MEGSIVNVTVEDIGACKKLVRFEVEPAKVDEQFESVTTDFTRHAALPGFRAGKAPRDMIVRKFEKEIQEEVKRKLMSETYTHGIKEQKLSVVGYPDIEEVQFGRGQPFQFIARLEIAPQFELPEYRNLPAKRERGEVTEGEMERAMEALRLQQAKFEKVERPAQEGDFVVVNYAGTSEGKPLTDFAPTAKGLTEKKNFWIEMKKDSFIPGFSEQLAGASAGEKRTVAIDFPADFVTPQLAGKKGVFEVEIVEVKQRNLPAIDEAFAKAYGAESLERLREGVRADLQNELNVRRKRTVRNQVVRALIERINFELPESVVQEETRSVVYELVNEYQRKGVSSDSIEQQKDEIYAVAARSAKDRVKLHFLFQRIAEREGIRVAQEEMTSRIIGLANQYQMAPDKFLKELEKRSGVQEIHSQLVHEKVVDFLADNAKIEEVEREQVPA
jgi:trigger factor